MAESKSKTSFGRDKRRRASRTDQRRGIQSAEAAMKILNVFVRARAHVSLSNIAKQAGVAPSTAYRYLVSLQRGGLVRQNNETGLYDLGPAALQLGIAAMRRLDVIEIAAVAARTLSEASGVTSFVSIWTDDGPMIVRWYHGHQTIITTAGIGAVLPVVTTSTGKIFAAYLPATITKRLWAKELASGTYLLPKGESFENILRMVRAEGFAWIDGSIVTGLRAISAPVFNMQGDIQATVTLMSIDSKLVALPNDLLKHLLSSTRDASSRLGYDPHQT